LPPEGLRAGRQMGYFTSRPLHPND